MLYVVLWVESHVIIMLQYDTGMIHVFYTGITYVFCDIPRYVVLRLSHESSRCSKCRFSILS